MKEPDKEDSERYLRRIGIDPKLRPGETPEQYRTRLLRGWDKSFLRRALKLTAKLTLVFGVGAGLTVLSLDYIAPKFEPHPRAQVGHEILERITKDLYPSFEGTVQSFKIEGVEIGDSKTVGPDLESITLNEPELTRELYELARANPKGIFGLQLPNQYYSGVKAVSYGSEREILGIHIALTNPSRYEKYFGGCICGNVAEGKGISGSSFRKAKAYLSIKPISELSLIEKKILEQILTGERIDPLCDTWLSDIELLVVRGAIIVAEISPEGITGLYLSNLPHIVTAAQNKMSERAKKY